MVPVVTFRRSNLKTSRLAFGLSRLHHVPGSTARQRLLCQAFELGIIHFDAARLYGDGLAEAALGAFLKGRRDRIIVATKFGLSGSPFVEAMPLLGMPLRGLRMVGRRAGLYRDPRPRWDIGSVRKSVTRSLRALATDYIDILFLHEPTMAIEPFAPDLLREIDRLKRDGVVRFVGLSGGWEGVTEVAERYPTLQDVLQVPERAWQADGPVPDLTYSVIAQGPQSYRATPPSTEEALRSLRHALDRRPDGSVVVSTTKPNHLSDLANVAAETIR